MVPCAVVSVSGCFLRESEKTRIVLLLYNIQIYTWYLVFRMGVAALLIAEVVHAPSLDLRLRLYVQYKYVLYARCCCLSLRTLFFLNPGPK